LIQAIILLLLLFDVLPYHRFVSTYGRDEVPSGPEVLPYKIALLIALWRLVREGVVPDGVILRSAQ
jgi:hypothetical protein